MVQKQHVKRIGEEEGLGSVLEFMRRLWQVDHGLQSMSKRMERKIGVTGPQRLVCRVVSKRPRISAGELARTLLVDPSTLTGVLRRLEHRGLIQRFSDPADGRRALFDLTDAGRNVAAEKTGTVEEAVRRAMTRVPVEVLLATQMMLQVLAEELGL